MAASAPVCIKNKNNNNNNVVAHDEENACLLFGNDFVSSAIFVDTVEIIFLGVVVDLAVCVMVNEYSSFCLWCH